MKKLENKNLEIIESFDELKLNDNIYQGIFSYGYNEPSTVQKYAIKPILDRKDCIINEKSGTGKTGAFVIGSLGIIEENYSGCQVIILNPTRELACQTFNVYKELGKYVNISIGLHRGGCKMNEYERHISNNKNKSYYDDDIIICTPGRLLHLLDKKIINVSELKLLVMDEADEMLSRGFLDDIKKIFNYLPDGETTKISLFSATIPQDVIDLSDKFMSKDKVIYILENDNITLDGIKQFFVNVRQEKYKLDCLKDIYNNLNINKSIIYCNKKENVEFLSGKLKDQQFTVSSIHGEMDQNERTKILKNFRDGDSNILLSTDLLSRGIDIQLLSLVVNYDIPTKKENYIHRIGRSGRMGKKGVAINIVVDEDIKDLSNIIKYYNIDINELPELSEINLR